MSNEMKTVIERQMLHSQILWYLTHMSVVDFEVFVQFKYFQWLFYSRNQIFAFDVSYVFPLLDAGWTARDGQQMAFLNSLRKRLPLNTYSKKFIAWFENIKLRNTALRISSVSLAHIAVLSRMSNIYGRISKYRMPGTYNTMNAALTRNIILKRWLLFPFRKSSLAIVDLKHWTTVAMFKETIQIAGRINPNIKSIHVNVYK